jgi:hypothetical protein
MVDHNAPTFVEEQPDNMAGRRTVVLNILVQLLRRDCTRYRNSL